MSEAAREWNLRRKDAPRGETRRGVEENAEMVPEPIAVGETEAARLLGIGPRTLVKLRQAGEIPYARIRSRVVYSVADLRRWIAERTREGGAA